MKYFIIGTVFLFGAIGVMGWLKREPKYPIAEKTEAVQEILLGTSQAPIPIQTPKLEGAAEVPGLHADRQ